MNHFQNSFLISLCKGKTISTDIVFIFIDIHDDMICFSQLRLMIQYILRGIFVSILKKLHSRYNRIVTHTQESSI